MEKVTGIGGVFFKVRDPEGSAEWHRQHLGIQSNDGYFEGLIARSLDSSDMRFYHHVTPSLRFPATRFDQTRGEAAPFPAGFRIDSAMQVLFIHCE